MRLICLFAMCAVMGCGGSNGNDGDSGKDGSSCSVESQDEGALISCEDGSTAFVPNGTDGTDGTNGVNGKDGVDGTNGTDGQNGANGNDAAACVISIFDWSFCIDCPGQPTVCADTEDGCYGQSHPSTTTPRFCDCNPGYFFTCDASFCYCEADACTIAGKYGDGTCDSDCPAPDTDCAAFP